LSNWNALVRYGDDGELEIDNGGAGRSLRRTQSREGRKHVILRNRRQGKA